MYTEKIKEPEGGHRMLYSEFIEGTGCKANAHNHQVYTELEIIYMNTDCTKEHIYEMGKKLVDNSKSEKELELEARVNAEIEEHKAEIARFKDYIEDNEFRARYWKEQGDKEMIAFYRNPIKLWKQEIKEHRNQINALKWVLA